MPPCIYQCGHDANGREHWLPASLGSFGPLQVLHERICQECNEEFGRTVDEEFIRTGPEGVFRTALGLPASAREGRNPFMYRAAGAQPVRAVDTAPEPDEGGILWEAYNNEQGEPRGRTLEQIVITVGEGRRISVPFNVNWTPQLLRQAVAARGAEGGTLTEIYLDPEKLENAFRLLGVVFPGYRDVQHYGRDGAGQRNRTIGFENRLNDVYFRAIGKIAFHGALKFLDQLDGAHANFAPLREWLQGRAQRPAGVVEYRQNQIIYGIGGRNTLRSWGHVVAVEANYLRVQALLQFYIGPDRLPGSWLVHLGANPTRVDYQQAVGYLFRYFDEPTGGYDGDVIDLGSVRLAQR